MILEIFRFIILALACWRISYMLVNEVGPYKIFQRLRNRIINHPLSPIHCFKCTSVWVAFFLAPVNDPAYFIPSWLALSAIAIFLEAKFNVV